MIKVDKDDNNTSMNKSTKSHNSVPESTKILRRFNMNDQAKYSITRPFEADQISEYIVKNVINELHKNPAYCTITDGTAGVGGDVINLCKHFGYVNAVEKDKETYKLLIRNLVEFEVSNASTYNKDYVQMMHNLDQDVVYMDPPWGGTNYKEKLSLPLFLSEKSLASVIKDLFESKPNLLIFIKAPINIQRDSFREYIKETIPIQNKQSKPSFILLKLKNVDQEY